MEIRAKVREFICSNFYLPRGATLDDSASLLDAGIIDSTGVLELIVFLEEVFGIQVQDQELLPENLDRVDAIVAYLARKLGI